MSANKNEHPVLLLTRKYEPASSSSSEVVGIGDNVGDNQQTQKQHVNLTKSILKLSQNKKGEKRRRDVGEQRTEFAPKVSEFTFKGGVGGSVKVDLRDLSRPLTAATAKGAKKDGKATAAAGDVVTSTEDQASDQKKPKINKKGAAIHKEVRSLKARQPARAPLVKHKEEQLLRKVGYNVAVDEVKKWKGVVKRNREAETVSFPLEQPSFNVSSTQELVQRFKPRTPLEVEVAKLLNGSESVLGQDRILTVREERALKAMDLEEAKRKRAELQKIRSLQSFAQVRSKRQGKIKSKRYHRRLRKEKEGENAKIYEELEKSHPERFQEMLDKMERKRVEERMTQRHKNNSKWVKSMMKLGKKDSEARTALNEALETSRKLTEKRTESVGEDDEGEEEDEEEEDEKSQTNGQTDQLQVVGKSLNDNPWLSSSVKAKKAQQNGNTEENKGEESEEETVSSLYPKLKEIKNTIESSDGEDDDDVDDDDEDSDKDEEDADDLPTVRDDDEDDGENEIDDDVVIAKRQKIISGAEGSSALPAPSKAASTTKTASHQEVDPTKILLQTPEVVSSAGQLPSLASYDNGIDDDGDDDDTRRLTIEEAFADDDVVAEFEAAKAAIVDRETPKAVCTAIPGWGDWVGGNKTGVSEKRRKKFTEKLTPEQRKPRWDKDKPRVIINEKQRDPKLAKHLVSDIPTRDFDSVKEFEKSIRAPVGRMFNAEAAYQKLIVPAVTTKSGTIIQPINKEKTFLRKEEDEEGEDSIGDEEEQWGKKGKKRKRDGGKQQQAGKKQQNFKIADQKNKIKQKAKKLKK